MVTIGNSISFLRTLLPVLGLSLSAATHGCDDHAANYDEPIYRAAANPSLADFDKIFILGDSLSDTFRMGSGYIPWCPQASYGYWYRRFSNGYLWIDYLTQDNPALASKVQNWAVGGSGVLKRYGSGIIGKSRKQAEDLVAGSDEATRSNSIAFVWTGANDIKEATKNVDAETFGHALFDTLETETLDYLIANKLEKFVLVGLPPIDRIPLGQTWSEADQAWTRTASQAYNRDLEAYAQCHGHVYLDVGAKIIEVLEAEVTSVNMTDLSTPCHDGANCFEQDPTHWPGPYTDQRCEGKMFFDRVHPTTGAHCGIAKWMEQAISTKYTIDGGDEDLESCARRVQTEAAQWGSPLSTSTVRSKRFKVETPRYPTDVTCQARCNSAGQAMANGDKGNITLPSNTEVGYCTCTGGNG